MANKPKFQPLAGETHHIIFSFPESPFEGDSQYGHWWSYAVKVNNVEYTWFVKERAHNMIVAAKPLKDIAVTLNIGQKRSQAGKPYNVYELITPTGTFSSSDSPKQSAPANNPTQPVRIAPPPKKSLEDIRELMLKCFEHAATVMEGDYGLPKTAMPTFEDLQKIAVSLFIEANRNGVIIPSDIKQEIAEGVAQQEYSEINPPPPGEDDLPFD